MANEIVKLVAKKANISEPIAQIAVDTVLNFVKGKLPAGIADTLNAFIGAAPATSSSKVASKAKSTAGSKTTSKNTTKKSDNPLGDLSSIANALGGLLGKK